MSRAKRDLEKEAFWRLVGDEHRRSGLTAREFCRKEGVSEASFHSWKRVLKERDREANGLCDNRSGGRASGSSLVSEQRKKQPSAGENSFVPVEVVASPLVASPELTIRTPAGFTINLPPTADIGRFGEIMEVLARQSPCLKPNMDRDGS